MNQHLSKLVSAVALVVIALSISALTHSTAGAQGFAGATGVQGVQGLDGPRGAKGITGSTSVQKGATGHAGLMGRPGAPGPIGDAGPRGADTYAGNGIQVIKLKVALNPTHTYTLIWSYAGKALIVRSVPAVGLEFWVNELNFSAGVKTGTMTITGSAATAFGTGNDPGHWTITISEV